MADTKTYLAFAWWQKIIFWTFILHILDMWFWAYVGIIHFANRKKNKEEQKERRVKAIYWWALLIGIVKLAIFGISFL